MARGINKVILIGNLGADPEVRTMPNGNQVANVTLATSDSWKDRQTGQLQERTEWHRVVFFGRLAEVVGQYLAKGSKIYIEGRLQTREWEKDGIKRYTTEVVVDMGGQMQMLDSRPSQSQGQQQYNQQQPQQTYQQQAPQQQPPYNPNNANYAPQQNQGHQGRQQRPAPVAQVPPQQAHYDNQGFDDDIPF